MRIRGRHLVGLVAASVVLLHASAASASVTCDRVAGPGGSDSNPGTAAAPFATPQKLVDSLSSGQTGCFRAGTTVGSFNISTPNLTLTSYPGERGTVQGRLWVTAQGPGTTVADLNLDGRPGATSPTISASDVTFSGDDVTDHNTAICFSIGSASYRPNNVVIENNNIHNCGELPATNQHHGIYVASATNTVIRNNWIHHNADRGIQLYPAADGTQITGNIIDSNGEGVIFSGGTLGSTYQTSDNNVVEHNLITNAQVRQNVESYWPSGQPAGTGNVVSNNCIKGTADPSYATADGSGVQSPQVGFTAQGNLVADPLYMDAANGDYRLQSNSPCASILAGGDVTSTSTSSTSGSSTGGTTTGGTTGGSGKGGKKKKARKTRIKKAHVAKAKVRAKHRNRHA